MLRVHPMPVYRFIDGIVKSPKLLNLARKKTFYDAININ